MFLKLVEHGRAVGMSEHQVAKYLTLLSIEDGVDNEALLSMARSIKRAAMRDKDRVKPL